MKIYNSSNELIIDAQVDDNSYESRSIMGEQSLTLYLRSAEFMEIPIGSYCDFQGERYTLMRPENLKMQHSRYFEYTIIMESESAKADIWKFRNPVDGRLKFSLTATPREHLQMIVDNLNDRETGWTIGTCITDTEHTISYDHHFIKEALAAQAEEFNTEYEIEGKVISLKKIEYNKTSPLPLSYGKGNGFISGVSRMNESENPPVDILFVQGGDQNLDPSQYGNKELLLPENGEISYDGEKFEDEEGYDATAARHYKVSTDRLSIIRTDGETPTTNSEDSLDCSDIFPKRTGTISDVITVDAEKHFYDFIDSSIPQNLNFEDCLIEGEQMSVIFQTGMLAGKEFEVKYFHEANATTGKQGRRFEIVPQEIDGQTMPNETYKPSATEPADTYAVFKCRLPQAYICDSETKAGAEWDMFRKAVRYKYGEEENKFTFTGQLDAIWAKQDWENIGGKIILGGFILFHDDRFQTQNVKIRITAIKKYINNPHSPEITLSNVTVAGGVAGTIKDLVSQEVAVEDAHREAISYTKRRFRDAKETTIMLENMMEQNKDALIQQFTGSITPISVQAMQMIVGDESLQFRYVDSKTTPHIVTDGITYNQETKTLHCPAKIVQHLTLGIKSISSSHETSEYKFWDVNEFTSGTLDTPIKGYYLYIRIPEDDGATSEPKGTYIMTDESKSFRETGYYNLLVGVLNSEYEGERSFTRLYGFTEILPSRITTEKVMSGDGLSYFDMVSNAMKLGDALDFNSDGDGRLKLKGTIVQSQSGDTSPIGCYRGDFDNTKTYYFGDEISYLDGTVTSTYRSTSQTPIQGILPTDTTKWKMMAKGGATPVCFYCGLFNPNKTYYGNEIRLCAVKYGDTYYVTKTTAGNFQGSEALPTDTTKWNPFGASLESVATDLLLAEEANVAGWIFRDGILYSENGNAWLDGVNGKMRLSGTIQMGTSYNESFEPIENPDGDPIGGQAYNITTDANIISLPPLPTGRDKYLILPHNIKDIGKICLFANTSPKGGGNYIICGYETIQFKNNETTNPECSDIANYRLEPNEKIEFTNFEKMPSAGYDVASSWICTNRFTLQEFQREECMGRYASMVAMGEVRGTNNSADIVRGEYYDGRELSQVMTATRISKGTYKIEFNSDILPTGYYVFATGSGRNYGGNAPLKATIVDRDFTEFTIIISDDDSANDGNANFVIFSPAWSESQNW